MTPQERQNTIEHLATTGNIIIATITQNMLKTYYDDRFIDDYLFSLTETNQMSREDMSEILGCSVYDFYLKNKDSLAIKKNDNSTWEETMSNLIQQEIIILIKRII